jgi:hypothetical protein
MRGLAVESTPCGSAASRCAPSEPPPYRRGARVSEPLQRERRLAPGFEPGSGPRPDCVSQERGPPAARCSPVASARPLKVREYLTRRTGRYTPKGAKRLSASGADSTPDLRRLERAG